MSSTSATLVLNLIHVTYLTKLHFKRNLHAYSFINSKNIDVILITSKILSFMEDDSKKRSTYLKKLGRQTEFSTILFVIVLCFAISVISFSILNTLRMQKASHENAHDYVNEVTVQIASTLNTDQKSIKDTVAGVASTIKLVTSDGIDETSSNEYITNYLQTAFDFNQFEYVVFIRSSGDVLKAGSISENTISKFTESFEPIHEAIQTNECVAYVDNDNILFVKTLENDASESLGIIVVGVNANRLYKLVDMQMYRDENNFCLTNREGKLLIKSGDSSFEELNDLFNSDEKKMETLSLELEEKIKNGESGVLEVTFDDGDEYMLGYAPVNGEDWMVLTLTPIDVFAGVYTRYMRFALVGSCLSAVVFVILLSLLVSTYKKAKKRLEEVAFVDELTQGNNGVEFQIKYENLQRKGDPLQYSIVFMDVKEFKLINEADGFEVGDAILKHIYNSINFEMNSSEYEFVSRIEMDHFFVCMKADTKNEIQERVNRIVERINATSHGKESAYVIDFEVGASFIDDENVEINILEERARIAKKYAKGKSASEVVIFEKQMQRDIYKNRLLDGMAEESIKNHDFVAYYQPKVSMSTGKVKGAEALVRWNHPVRGLISPGEFIPVLEASGRIQDLDKYVFEELCRWLSERQKSGKEMFPISVNLSRAHFWKNNFLEDYLNIVDKYQVDHKYIEFEVTETLFMEESKHARIKKGVHLMHENGFKCAMDDFGVGYSSLSLVSDMDVDILKFDRSFFLDINNEKQQKVIRSLFNMASELQLEMVIEGIETQDQIDFLKKEKCDVIQGYYYSKPLPEDEFNEWIEIQNNKKIQEA